MSDPVWIESAKKEIGIHEVGDNRGPNVRRYSEWGHCGAEGEPWCAMFANAMLEHNSIPGTRSPLARSFEHSPNFVKLEGPAYGCIVTFWRGSPNSGLGHVGFYMGEHNGLILTLGGNESDMVKVEYLNSHGSNFGRFGYYWPKGVALPSQIGPIAPQMAEQGPVGQKVT